MKYGCLATFHMFHAQNAYEKAPPRIAYLFFLPVPKHKTENATPDKYTLNKLAKL